jgi:hypothetical protein
MFSWIKAGLIKIGISTIIKLAQKIYFAYRLAKIRKHYAKKKEILKDLMKRIKNAETDQERKELSKLLHLISTNSKL